MPFSWKMAISREYHGVYGLVSAMFFVEILTDAYLGGPFAPDPFWICLFTACTLFYLAARFLDKKTLFLSSRGR
jgi:hypothetical protein